MLEFQSTSNPLLGSGRRVIYIAFPIYTCESDIKAFKSDNINFLESLYERSLGCEMMLYRRTLLAHALKAIYRLNESVDLFWGSEQMRLMGRMPKPPKV